MENLDSQESSSRQSRRLSDNWLYSQKDLNVRSNQNSDSVGPPIQGTFASNANILNDTDAQHNSIVMDMNGPLLDDSTMGKSQRVLLEQDRDLK